MTAVTGSKNDGVCRKNVSGMTGMMGDWSRLSMRGKWGEIVLVVGQSDWAW